MKRKQPDAAISHRPFAALADLVRKRSSDLQHTSTHAKAVTEPTTDDELFIHAMRDVREIPEFRAIRVSFGKKRMAVQQPKREPLPHTLLEEITCGRKPIILEQTQEFVWWLHPKEASHTGNLIVQRLHQGCFSVQDFLDLHGCTVPEADEQLSSFLKESLQSGFGCVKIIHGRGLRSADKPVLKSRVAHLLSTRFAKHVRAYVTARANDGGLGAVYVLLRSRPLSRK